LISSTLSSFGNLFFSSATSVTKAFQTSRLWKIASQTWPTDCGSSWVTIAIASVSFLVTNASRRYSRSRSDSAALMAKGFGFCTVPPSNPRLGNAGSTIRLLTFSASFRKSNQMLGSENAQ